MQGLHARRFLDALDKLAPAYAVTVRQVAERHPETFFELAEPLVFWARSTLGEDYLSTLVDGYVAFVTDVNEAQVRYEREGKYQHSNFDEVYPETYGDDDFMRSYHWGVYATTFAWEHHLDLYRFFRDDFLERLPQSGVLIDVGAGSGVYHLLCLSRRPELNVYAVDVSPASIAASRNMAERIGCAARITHVCADATTWSPPEPADAAVCCFLLEHVEQPRQVLDRLVASLKPRAYAYVTTALTAAETDHIFEWRRESEVVAMCEQAGCRVLAYRSMCPPTVPAERRFLPRSMGLLLQKRGGEIW